MDCHVSYEINGVVYTIQRDKINKSRLLNALLHNDGKMKVVKNETGAYIINRDNAFFPYIIQYLEKGKLPQTPFFIEHVIIEADFYGVQGLINDIICKSNYVQDFEQDFPPIDGVFLLLNKLCFQPEHKEDIAKKFFFNSKGKVQVTALQYSDIILNIRLKHKLYSISNHIFILKKLTIMLLQKK